MFTEHAMILRKVIMWVLMFKIEDSYDYLITQQIMFTIFLNSNDKLCSVSLLKGCMVPLIPPLKVDPDGRSL